MARKDGTGPLGYGPMTGRGLGPCADENTATPFSRRDRAGRPAGFRRRTVRGAGFGRGYGRGRGFGR